MFLGKKKMVCLAVWLQHAPMVQWTGAKPRQPGLNEAWAPQLATVPTPPQGQEETLPDEFPHY